ncbi:LOW QUALITY PROTEIN: hypothetical protein PHMEG_00012504 [Phytophthora megakarya]|uniref:PiggyBac transposable element-derived protein domain-containing protein n=1 Tax=Phytophthora megakarya TaxID=4795 RepID=A0A225WB53_9STRA|nr:LOW QUALITY PROTEIN: hypothetical protein PHMEG_00012504 [Phytophthora megakarya]
MILSRSCHNVTRQFMKDKLHKWGTKLFMTCCTDTVYWLRYVTHGALYEERNLNVLAQLNMLYRTSCIFVFRMYIHQLMLEAFCGTDQHSDELGGESPTLFSADANSGPAAVIRNLAKVIPSVEDGVFRVVVTDRLYTSVQLVMQLPLRNVRHNTDRQKGVPPDLITKKTSRPSRCASRIRYHCRRKVLFATSSNVVVGSAARIFAVNRQQHQRENWRHLQGGQHTAIPCPSARLPSLDG